MKRIPHLIPHPRSIVLGEESVLLADFTVSAESSLNDISGKYTKMLNLKRHGNAEKRLILQPCSALPEEEYRLQVSPNAIKVESSGLKGFTHCLHTMLQLKDGNNIPAVEINDAPALKVRGFHINFNALRQMQYDDAESILETGAGFKLNTLLVEYGDRFPYVKHPIIPSSNALSMENVRQLDQLAAENYMEIIPLLQSFGHLDYVLDHEEYAALREGGSEGGRQLCPLNPGSLQLFTELAEEMLAQHPGGRYLHIGGDETRHIGECPMCREEMQRRGKSGLYVDYINKVCERVLSIGRTPIIWDDMICRHPQEIDNLNREAVIMYWDYWASTAASPFVVARAAGRGLVYDKYWTNDSAVKGLTDTEKAVLQKFSWPMDLAAELPEEYLREFGPYLGDEFPRYITSFPYVRYYQDKGFKVIGAPTALGNHLDDGYNMPNYARFASNIREFSRRCAEEEALGVITTAWYSYPWEAITPGLLAAAQHTWNRVE